MTRTVNKRLLILLAAFVLVCGGMIALRGTFASQVEYTDSNKVELDGKSFNVDLQYWNGTDYVSLFAGNAQPFSDTSLWCPGRSEIVYLRLVSEENFPINAVLSLKVGNNGFDDVISYAVMQQDLLADSAAHPTSWSDYVSRTEGAKVLAGNTTHELLEVTPLTDSQCLALCLHMDESATSQYQNKQLSMNFALRLDADYEPGSDPANITR